MKRIVLVNQSTRHLMIDICNAYAKQYDEVVLLAGIVEEYERKFDPKVRVVKVTTYNRSSAIKRITTWGLAYLQILLKLILKYRGYEVLYFTNPPMSYFATQLTSNPFSIVVYDIYPDALRNIGIKESSIVFKWWSKVNRKVFAKAKNVITLSDGMADVLSKYIDREKITIIPNWPFSEKFAPVNKKENKFAIEHNIQDKFVVMYSGNMGYTHSVDVLIDAAEKLKDNNFVHFLLIGQGKKKGEMRERVAREELKNVTILDLQPMEVLPYSFATADLALITLNEESGAVSVPGKTYDLLSVGAPLLCICPPESDMNNLVAKYENGRCFRANQVTEIIDYIIEVAADKNLQKRLSDNSLKAAKNFTKENAEQYVNII